MRRDSRLIFGRRVKRSWRDWSTALRECVTAGVRDEMESARDRSKGKLEWKVDLLGSRPGGELAAGSPLMAALRGADEFLGNHSRLERSSTDANIPLSLGIDAIAIGAGGNGGRCALVAGMV